MRRGENGLSTGWVQQGDILKGTDMSEIRSEDWLMPEKIIDNGYKSYQDPDTGMIFTEYDLAMFAIKANEWNEMALGVVMADPDIFKTVPIKYVNDKQKAWVWTNIIQPWMSDPDRLTIQDMLDRATEISKQRYLEAISYIPEANRVKE